LDKLSNIRDREEHMTGVLLYLYSFVKENRLFIRYCFLLVRILPFFYDIFLIFVWKQWEWC